MSESAAADDGVVFESGLILAGPDDDIWDNIFDWIQNAISSITSNVYAFINSAVSRITSAVSSTISAVMSPISSMITTIRGMISSVSSWVYNVYATVSSWVSSAYNTVYSAVSSAITTAQSWINGATSTITSWVTTRVQQVYAWITTAASALVNTIRTWFSDQLQNINALLSSWGDNITTWLIGIGADLSAVVPNISGQLSSYAEWLATWITDHVVGPMDAWWDQFIGRVLDFKSWVSTLADAIWDWLQEDVPGHSPRKIWIWEDVGGFFYYWFGWYAEKVKADPPRAAFDVLAQGLGFVGEIFGQVAEVFWEAVDGYVQGLGPTNPDIAPSHANALSSLGLTALTGLAGMTLASSWMKPLGGAGMGQIAAMIYDMTNYKVITGASITALAVAAIRTPMTYHFNALFRPNIIEPRDFFELMSRRAFTEPENLQNPDLEAAVRLLTKNGAVDYEQQWIGYRGYPSEYFGIFKELANTPLRYFPLAGIARTGFFDKTWFTEALARSGYSQTAKDALMVMYEKMRDEALQGSFSGAAVTRFKEGFTDEGQFKAEMELLGYSEEQFKKYLAAAQFDYATDYTRDLITAYRDAARKGNLTLDQYRDKLLGLHIVPERVEAYVYRERARLKPEEELSALSPAAPVYETDAGKVQLDTIRRRRRKNLMSRDEEIAGMLELGIPTGYAEALADNDDVRLAEKAED